MADYMNLPRIRTARPERQCVLIATLACYVHKRSPIEMHSCFNERLMGPRADRWRRNVREKPRLNFHASQVSVEMGLTALKAIERWELLRELVSDRGQCAGALCNASQRFFSDRGNLPRSIDN